MEVQRELSEIIRTEIKDPRVNGAMTSVVAVEVTPDLKYCKETRWAGWQTRSDYPERDDAHFDCFIESRRDPATGEVSTFTRPYEQIIPGDRHTA